MATLGVYDYGIITEPTHLLSPTRAIKVPVLIGVGSEDFTMCGGIAGTDCSTPESVRAHVAPLYPNSERLDVFVLPGAGHMMNLALNAPDWFAAEIEWLVDVGLGP